MNHAIYYLLVIMKICEVGAKEFFIDSAINANVSENIFTNLLDALPFLDNSEALNQVFLFNNVSLYSQIIFEKNILLK